VKFLFIVQGEGRGHMTQAMSLNEILIKNGHEIVAVLVGKSSRREIPDFFARAFENRIFLFASPNFLPSSKKKQTTLWKTIIYNFARTGVYLKSISFIKRKIKELDIDIVVNFYDFLTGLTYGFSTPKTPCVCISHQYIFLHPDYHLPKANRIQLSLMLLYTKLTCLRASKRFALSIEEMRDIEKMRMKVVPPLLRKEIFNVQITKGDYLHGYMLNDNYADEICTFNEKNPDMQLHFFWDKKGVEPETVVSKNLSFHKLDDRSFIDYMSGCSGYATTAGFESVCEAMYMGKPVLMVPTHIEQECNAFEAQQSGAGIVADGFELDKLLDFMPEYSEKSDFRNWVSMAESTILQGFAEVIEKIK
jgi:uncharacterized protein (TIGR00661 family)